MEMPKCRQSERIDGTHSLGVAVVIHVALVMIAMFSFAGCVRKAPNSSESVGGKITQVATGSDIDNDTLAAERISIKFPAGFITEFTTVSVKEGHVVFSQVAAGGIIGNQFHVSIAESGVNLVLASPMEVAIEIDLPSGSSVDDLAVLLQVLATEEQDANEGATVTKTLLLAGPLLKIEPVQGNTYKIIFKSDFPFFNAAVALYSAVVGDVILEPVRHLQLNAGADLTFIVRESSIGESEVYGWGHNSTKQLTSQVAGDYATTPRLISLEAGTGNVAGGYGNSCALFGSRSTEIQCWGKNSNGEVGVGNRSQAPVESPEPVNVSSVSGNGMFYAFAVGGAHTCGVTAGGEIFCWGLDSDERLGDKDAQRELCDTSGFGTYCSSAPSTKVKLAEVASLTLSAGAADTCALTRDGKAYCWGPGYNVSLGLGQFDYSAKLIRDEGGESIHFIAIDVNWFSMSSKSHACGIDRLGRVYCWGAAEKGKLGNGATSGTEEQAVPVDFSAHPGETFLGLAIGGDHSCALARSGKIYCWGDNDFSQVGTGASASTYSRPQLVAADGVRFVGVSAGTRHTCALSDEGEVYCWGANNLGQVGDGSGLNELATPTLVTFAE